MINEKNNSRENEKEMHEIMQIIHSRFMRRLLIILSFFAVFLLIGLYFVDSRKSIKISSSIDTINKNTKTIFSILGVLLHNDSVAAIQLRHFPTSAPLDLIDMSKVTSEFQNRVDPVTKKDQFHLGVDYQASKGVKVYASADGIVEQANWNDGYGRYVRIDHLNGYNTIYAHLDSIMVVPFQMVKKGEQIGTVGKSGIATGTHLHYEITYMDKHINPTVFTSIMF